MKNEDIKKLVDPGTWHESFEPETKITIVTFQVCGIPFSAQYDTKHTEIYAIRITSSMHGDGIENLHYLITKLRETE